MSLTKVSYSMINGATANVLDYGASPSATAAQNAAAFTAAIATGKTVYIPDGEYLLNPITIINGANIIGESVTATILKVQGSSPIITWNYDTNGNVVLQGFLLSNLTFNTTALTSTQCVRLIGAQYCQFSNLKFKDTGTSTATAIYLEFSYFVNFNEIRCQNLYAGIAFYGANYNRGPNFNVIRNFYGENLLHWAIRLDYARGNTLANIDLEYSNNNLYYGIILDNSSYNQIQGFWYEAGYATVANAAILIQGDTTSTNKKNAVIWSPQIIHPSNAIWVVNSVDTTLDDVRFVNGTVNVQDDGNTGLTIINPQSESASVGLLSSGSTTTKIISYNPNFTFTQNVAANLFLNSIQDGYNAIGIKNVGVTKFAVGTKPSTNEVSMNTAVGEVLRIQDTTGFLVPVKGAFQFVNNITSATAAQNCLFVDSADGILKFKDGSSVVHNLY